MKKAEVQRKFDEIVDFSGVEKFIDTPVKRYSSGMYVRLAFAVAAHLDPEILVVDEVLAVGDAEFQKKCLGKMGDVAGEGRTVMFVSHNMTAIHTLCPKCAWINSGKLQEIGGAEDIIHAYLRSSKKEASNSYINLENWEDRYGDGQAKFISAKLIDQNGEITTQFLRTKPLSVEMVIESVTTRSLVLSVVVVNDLGANILHLSQFDSPNEFNLDQKGYYRITSTIPNLPCFQACTI